MDIGNLIKGAPDLLSGLKDLGLDDGQVGALGDEVGSQLLGSGGLDLGDLLKGFDVSTFLDRIDLQALASRVGIDPSTARSALMLIAPKVEAFTGDVGGIVDGIVGGMAGKLGSLASGFLKRD